MKILHRKIAALYSMLFALMLLVPFVMLPDSAHAAVTSIPFGGTIISFNPPTPPTCVYSYTLVFNFSPVGLKIIGLTLGPVPGMLPPLIFAHANLTTPKTFVLGSYRPTPVCSVPFPVFPIDMIGTGSF